MSSCESYQQPFFFLFPYMPRLSGGIPPDTIYYHMRRVDARHATRHDSEATGRYAAYAPTRKRLNTPTTAHSSSTTRHAH